MTIGIQQFRQIAQTAAERVTTEGTQLKDSPVSTGSWLGRMLSFSSTPAPQKISAENKQAIAEFKSALRAQYGKSIASKVNQMLPDGTGVQPLSARDVREAIEAADGMVWSRAKTEFHESLVNLERDPRKFAAGTRGREQAEAIFQKLFDRVPSDKRQMRVDEVRKLVDTLPNHIPEHVVNTGHRVLNDYDRKVGIQGVKYLGPSKTGASDEHVINRGISEVVVIDGKAYTPIYMTIYSSVLDQERPGFKDVGQDKDGRIQIHTGGSDGGENTLWISAGRPLRQVKWLEKYAAQGATAPVVRSFLVPLSAMDEISKAAITEHKSKDSGKDMNVDKHFERNQFGILPKSLDVLRRHALPGSLRSYTDSDISGGKPDTWGELRPASELREKLGIPPKRLKDFSVFVDHTSQDFTSKSGYEKQADTLMRIYALHKKDPEFLPAKETIPDSDQTRQQQVQDFFTKHRPDGFTGTLDEFVTDYIAPWATQARIAQEISEDFDDIAKNRASLPTEAPEIDYSGGAKIQYRGERRTRETKLGEENRVQLEKRAQFRSNLGVATEKVPNAYKVLPQGDPARRLLGPLEKYITTIHNDYGFQIGDMETLKSKEPEYREEIAERCEQLKAIIAPEQTKDALKPIIEALEIALG